MIYGLVDIEYQQNWLYFSTKNIVKSISNDNINVIYEMQIIWQLTII